ncbi:MAG: phosphate ABC transporter substrate-binding protein PstS [Nitrospiraceae bacterium]|nr:phosphate ABC transporter substrate-binding protein PstS [Nitrospiraceae bacterium]
MKRFFLSLALVLAVPLVFGTAFAAQAMVGAGSTFAYPIYSAWAYQYAKITGVQLNYQSIGSGGGIRQIENKVVDFGASDAPLSPADLAAHHLLQFPTVVGGVIPCVNIPGIGPGRVRLDGDTLAKIYMGEIKNWTDPRIKALNPGLKLPDHEITCIHRSEASGTTAIFTHYLSSVSAKWKSGVGMGTDIRWPVGIGAKGNEGVANYIKRVPDAIGYVEFAYVMVNHMAYVKMKNASGHYVTPSFASFKNAAGKAAFSPKNDFDLWLVSAPGRNSWPIVGGTFILLSKDQPQSNSKVVKFFDWSFKKGDPTAVKLEYVPLPLSLKNKIRAYWKAHGLSY